MKFSKKKLFFAILMMFITGISMFIYMYLTDTDFQNSVNILVSSKETHWYTFENDTHTIPLPKETALLFRTSDTEAFYVTKQTREEVVLFYKDLANPNSFKQENSFNIDQLELLYNNKRIYVTISDIEKQKSEIRICVEEAIIIE